MFLIQILIFLVVVGLLWWATTLLPLPDPIPLIIRVVVVIFLVICLVYLLLSISGHGPFLRLR